MRVGIVRSDINKIFLNDIESRSQRCFSMEPYGQTRYLHKPTSEELLNVLNKYATLTSAGNNGDATVDTTGANATKLNIRTSATGAFSQVVVTSGAAITKDQIVFDLNAGFKSNGLPLIARVDTHECIMIDTLAKGPGAYIEVSATLPSVAALHTVLGLGATMKSGLSVDDLKAAVYPTEKTIDVSTVNILSLSTFSSMTIENLIQLREAIANVIAPHFVETGMVLLSFAYGNLSKMRSPNFWPGGSRSGIPAGVCAAVVEDDGFTPFLI